MSHIFPLASGRGFMSHLPPLPLGEGWGEGINILQNNNARQGRNHLYGARSHLSLNALYKCMQTFINHASAAVRVNILKLND